MTNANPAQTPELVNAKEAGRMLGISDRYVKALVDRGDLESVQVGSRRMVPVDGIRDYVAQRLSVARPTVAAQV